ncbi:hypothetical protein KKB71_01985 [Patescibacteria group bacterium]|nr:hypothetical protein [Patescibacteria group bacterium]MBU2263059.1 hypothetical protein [Patescibacteria group bacterium]
MNLKDLWQEAGFLTDERIEKKVIIFLSLILTEHLVGPILFWCLEGRKNKKIKK